MTINNTAVTAVNDTSETEVMSGGYPGFEALLAGVLSHDNEERKRAETVYNETLDSKPAVVVTNLLQCLEKGQV